MLIRLVMGLALAVCVASATQDSDGRTLLCFRHSVDEPWFEVWASADSTPKMIRKGGFVIGPDAPCPPVPGEPEVPVAPVPPSPTPVPTPTANRPAPKLAHPPTAACRVFPDVVSVLRRYELIAPTLALTNTDTGPADAGYVIVTYRTQHQRVDWEIPLEPAAKARVDLAEVFDILPDDGEVLPRVFDGFVEVRSYLADVRPVLEHSSIAGLTFYGEPCEP